ncbi:MAG: V-type ATP synthase subunit D [Candidatus Parvarchaeota archaeon]|nr:V-type ATP synthase subunit D [Candidatus Parvarchaeota archaeon]
MEISMSVTRRELIETLRRIDIARKGLELLKIKRSSLIFEFFKLLREIQRMRIDLIGIIRRSEESLKIAEALSGSAMIEKIAEEQREARLSLNIKNVMGILVSDAQVANEDDIRNDVLIAEMPTPIYDAKKYYVNLLSSLVNVAEKESTMKKILREVYSLNRRVNSLEYTIIPRWERKVKYITERLEDSERDRLVSIKFFKKAKVSA